MVRMARAVIVGNPYHLTHRGNQRREVFFCDLDRQLYLADFAVWAHDCGLRIWAYCLMSNHVHLIGLPRSGDAMARAVGRTHQRHARRINAERGWTGHLWANRFFSTALDEAHLWSAVRYVELNPVRAGLCARAEEWPWSSAGAHCAGPGSATGGPLLDPARPFGGQRPDPLTGRPMGWADWLARADPEEEDRFEHLSRATLTGRPCGGDEFIREVEARLGRKLTKQKPGPKPHAPDQRDQIELKLE